MKTVTFYIGAPGAGKSTEAFRQALELKERNESVFFVQERATRLAFSERLDTYDKSKLFDEQYAHIEEALDSNADHVVCDTSQILALVYDSMIEGHKEREKKVRRQFLDMVDRGLDVQVRFLPIVDSKVIASGRLRKHTDFITRRGIEHKIKHYLDNAPWLRGLVVEQESKKVSKEGE